MGGEKGDHKKDSSHTRVEVSRRRVDLDRACTHTRLESAECRGAWVPRRYPVAGTLGFSLLFVFTLFRILRTTQRSYEYLVQLNEVVEYRAALAGRWRARARSPWAWPMPCRDEIPETRPAVGGRGARARRSRSSMFKARWNCFVPYSRGGSSSSSLSLPPSLWDGNAAAASLAIA